MTRSRRFALEAATGLCALACGTSPTSPGTSTPPAPTPPGAALVFSVSPIPTAAIEFITPLGNLNPPDHTFPTDHIYFYYRLFHPAAPAYEVQAPAAGTVVSIVQHGDQKISVRAATNQTYYLDHITLDPPIVQNATIVAGQRLGVTSGRSFGIDLGVVNSSVTLGFINPARYGDDSLHADMPLKYFDDPLRSTLYGFVQRSGPDKDGQVCFDRAGTLAGNWFLDSLPVSESSVFGAGPMQIAFVRDPNDPSQPRVSIGGTLAMTGIFGIAAGQDPGTVTPSTGLVEYQLSPLAFGSPPGILLARMTANDVVRLEAIPGATPGLSSFTTSARSYVR